MPPKKAAPKPKQNDNRISVSFPDPAVFERVVKMAEENGNISASTQAYMLINFAIKQHDAAVEGKKK